MSHPFTQAMPTLDNYWRSIVLFGQNTACYKFALAHALLETAKTGVAEVPLNNLAEVFADHVCQHLIKYSIQGTNPTNSEIHVGSEDLQSGPEGVVSFGEHLGVQVSVINGQGHMLSIDYVGGLLDHHLRRN